MKRHFTWILLGLALLAFVITHFIWTADLPQRLATHFDLSGRANGWMSRGQHSAFMLLTGIGMTAFLMLIGWSIRHVSPSLVNVPKPQYWRAPENFPKACAILFGWMRWQAINLLLWITYLNYLLAKANRVSPPHLSSTGMVTLTAVFLVLEASMVGWLLLRFHKTDAGERFP